jgi:hypothetical protein
MLLLVLRRNPPDSQMCVRNALFSIKSLEIWFLMTCFVLASAVKPAVTFGVWLRFKDRLFFMVWRTGSRCEIS